ncbi:MAG TPA: ribonuclease Z [Bacteroidia bacterium]|nr:ribonuclease Z [Bacteroidia bacterium]
MASAFEVTILGCSSATPTSKRFPTSQLLNIAERFFLIDCGEATQIQLRRYHIRFQRINHIFISHLHGDHYLGLMGLLSSLHLLGRKKSLHIYHPPGLKKIIDLQLELSGTILNYEITWHEHNLEKPTLIYEDQIMTVETVILYHRIPCCGFIFREKPRPYSLDKEKLVEMNIPRHVIPAIKKGHDAVLDDGTVIPNLQLTLGSQKARSYAFCSDTRYDQRVIDAVKGVDMLYHEATFMHELLDRAITTFHTTAKEAGMVAKAAGVGKLIIGHYSVRYTDLRPLLNETQTEFSATELAEEGSRFNIPEQLIVKK